MDILEVRSPCPCIVYGLCRISIVMDQMHAEITFSLVFAGRLVAGRNAANVEKAFGGRFGEATAQSVFGATSCTLKRGLSRENALKFQQVL